MSERLEALLPVVDEGCTRLVLGSMPGEVSLQEGRYYAHPRNGFWPIMYGLYGQEPEEDYERRKQFLLKRGIGLWDVLAACERSGSLDSAIRNPEVNEFAPLLEKYPGIETFFFNGGKAYELFMRHAAPKLTGNMPKLVKLPSTSPAYTLPLKEKLEQWRVVADSK
ncbi:DNA-deoxyinosine glycosylase [Paenibacillus tarimensis]|uniref:DNA-deoxyinosine glycosylase n=1 Tax=Paenibacillus tarimensis TaxID=416012 RepID=UPI001F1C3ABC|nr:DNA-deoxyinosine glycosylase [Paenibacillus tarimensis]MCF2943851.1 DNA-deoxyinosine glycosylase [Paenibacillus tarimensis]